MTKRKAPKMGIKRKAPKKSASPKSSSASSDATLEDAPRVLHCHSTFAPGGKELRAVQLMNAFGNGLRHSIVSGVPDEIGAHVHIDRSLKVGFPKAFPSLTGWPSPARLVAIAKAMKAYDLVLTYNWGAMDVVMAHTVFAKSLSLPPLIHHEDGFNEDEATQLKTRRNLYRRAALGKASALVVPSKGLEQIALNVWELPKAKVQRIPNGIDTKAFAQLPNPKGFRLVKREGEGWIGTLAGLRAVKQLDQLVRAFSVLPDFWQLVILGEGPERDTISAVADSLEISHRVHMPGAIKDPASIIGMFDIFALSSASEQFPLSVVEAMAAGLPIAAPDVGDIRSMVTEENLTYIAPAGDTAALGEMFERLSVNPDIRKKVGAANKAKARAMYDEAKMIERYRSLYSEAMGREF